MRGKGIESIYLITRIFSTDYFHYYSNPALFSTYFFPFVAYGKSGPYSDDELNQKLNNIKNNKHGNYYNYATQGFGNVAFYLPHVSFNYFYNQLSKYDMDKSRYFDIQHHIKNIEADKMREDLFIVLSKDKLLLKRDFLMLESIKNELLYDLRKQEVKYVLAKLLYYIVCEQHVLPDAMASIRNDVLKNINLPIDSVNSPNISLGFRKDKDSELSNLYCNLKKAKSVQILCLTGISIFGDIKTTKNQCAFEKFKGFFTETKTVDIEIILSTPRCISAIDACNYQMNYNHLNKSKIELAEVSLKKLAEMKNLLPNNKLSIKITDKAIPYSLFIVKFENPNMDYIKVDLYSPFVEDNHERPSMYILKSSTPDLFTHFSNVFDKMWKSDMYSSFI